MPASSPTKDLAQEARFVFRGTVKKLTATTMPEVPVSDRTIVVTVNEIRHATAALAELAGKDITVQLSTRERFKVGQEAVFYTNGWLFGKSVAVQSLGQHAPEKAAAKAPQARTEPAQALSRLASQDLEKRVTNADVVVYGHVTSVRLPAETVAARAAGAPATANRISEHDPAWQEAVVEVASVEKGHHTAKQLVVRFPSSTDVRWHKAPKFRPNQEGVFILHKDAAYQEIKRAAGLIAEEGEEAYTALDPMDFQPEQQLESIRGLMSTRASR